MITHSFSRSNSIFRAEVLNVAERSSTFESKSLIKFRLETFNVQMS
jgi:hypothetical protein